MALAIFALIVCIWGAFTLAAKQGVKQRLAVIEERYKVKIKYQAVTVNGLDQVTIKGVTFVPRQSTIRFYAGSFTVRIGLLSSSASKEDIKSFEINDLDIYYAQPSGKKGKDGKPNYAAAVKNVFDGLSSVIPSLPPIVSVRSLRLIYQNKRGDEASYYIPSLEISGSHFRAQMQNESGKTPAYWICQGSYSPKTSGLSLRLYRDKAAPAEMPVLKNSFNATVKFDTLAIDIKRKSGGDNLQILTGKIGVKGLTVDHEDLNYEPVFFDKGFAGFKLNIGENFIELDRNETRVNYKRLQFNPYLLLVKNKHWRIRAAVDKADFPANDLFRSFPVGLFNNLEGMKVAGTMSYHFYLDLDMSRIDDLVFESNAETHNFRILSYGKTNLALMSKPFIHTIYERGKKVRDIEVGDTNPNFADIKILPKNLLNAVLYAEDYSFYNHNGFYGEAFTRSLVENLKNKRFVRGASTISMQVVKNVFLGLNKLVARKFEEILIVWLIENNDLTSKSRLFEVYLNIIEWGPGIYGITEASRYYFIKEPAALTLSECIFLAYIIPSPKKLKENFHGMRPNVQYYEFFDDMLKRMKRRGVISARDFERANPDVNFRGAVVNYLQLKF